TAPRRAQPAPPPPRAAAAPTPDGGARGRGRHPRGTPPPAPRGRRASSGRSRLAVVAQLDGVAVGILDVDRGADTAGAEPGPALAQGAQVGGLDDQTDVVDVGAQRTLAASDEVDDGGVVDPGRWERRLPAAPLVDPDLLEAEEPAVPGE